MGELLKMTPTFNFGHKERMKKKGKIIPHFLFEGDSCFPISPLDDETKQKGQEIDITYSNDDQIAKILDKIDPVRKDDKEFLDAQ